MSDTEDISISDWLVVSLRSEERTVMSRRQSPRLETRIANWNDTWALAVVFGLASIPWTYGFVAGLHVPLWPSFIASGSFYAAGTGLNGLVRGYASNLVGIIYAAATLAVVNTYLGGGVVALSLVVGVFMFLASLHEFVPVLSFTPGGFFGYATMFSVSAADAAAFGIAGLPGETLAAIVSMFIGAVIGLVTDEVSSIVGE
ncbi:DUF1097 domain-containing protein [Haloterrigena salifodinae]|uniref:DUF1097 domain-containing protein n=1 Tax=Haloterrigena salifodinae TaxID=2675099 RepID=A0A8T8E3J6_9EURY|nr:DUF1097 domain-containing protein [Haloterrigena salifodinae]QRV16133.1 DUF1097 domain-containing protein [Haloterrigena salifodinae]